jgi:hypothetical protein
MATSWQLAILAFRIESIGALAQPRLWLMRELTGGRNDYFPAGFTGSTEIAIASV